MNNANENIEETLKTVKAEKEYIEIIKGSKFISRIYNVISEDEAKEKIAEINELEKEATHNCYAYITGTIERFSDDGEPSKTAGYPILEAIKGAELSNVLIIITRYFGGTLLGTGGLIRAYGSGAKSVIEISNVLKYSKGKAVLCTIPYNIVDKLKRDLAELDSEILSEEYLENVKLKVSIPLYNLDRFKSVLSNLLEKDLSDEDYIELEDTYVRYK